jgi:putative ABC transport system permease protein
VSAGFIDDFFIQLREATIHSQYGHLQVYRRGYYEFAARAPYRYMIEEPDALAARLRSVAHVIDVAPRVYFSGLLSNTRMRVPVIAEGVDAAKELKLSRHMTVTAGSMLLPQTRYGVMVGDGLARALNLKIGDNVALLVTTREGALNSLDFEVAGIFRSFSKEYDDRALRMPLASAQELLDTPSVHSLVIDLDDTSNTEEVARAVAALVPRGEFEIKTWYELADFYQRAVDLYRRYFLVLRAIIFAMVLLAVVNSVNMTIYERTGEYGMLRAMGNRRKEIRQLILAENTLLGLIGSSAGIVLGIGIALVVSAVGVPMPPMPNSSVGYTAAVHLSGREVFVSFMVGLFATCLAAVAPAWRASRVPIVTALARN